MPNWKIPNLEVPGFTVVETFPPDYRPDSSLRLATIEECAEVASQHADFLHKEAHSGGDFQHLIARRTEAIYLATRIRALAKDRGEANPLEKAARIADHAAEMANNEGRTRCEQDLRAVALAIRALT